MPFYYVGIFPHKGYIASDDKTILSLLLVLSGHIYVLKFDV